MKKIGLILLSMCYLACYDKLHENDPTPFVYTPIKKGKDSIVNGIVLHKKPLWYKRLGDRWIEGRVRSRIFYKNMVLTAAIENNTSYLVALDINEGRELYRKEQKLFYNIDSACQDLKYLYVWYSHNAQYGLDISTGDTIWKRVNDNLKISPLFVKKSIEGKVFVFSDFESKSGSAIYQTDIRTGEMTKIVDVVLPKGAPYPPLKSGIYNMRVLSLIKMIRENWCYSVM